MRVVRAAGWLPCLCLCACASASHGPFFDDEKYLRFGLDPSAEARAIVQEREKLGDALAQQIMGEHFTALGFVDTHGTADAVRVVTARGIVLALDRTRESALTEAEIFELVPAPMPGTQDADGDGFEEVFIAARRGRSRCLLVYRVRDVGFADAVTVPTFFFGEQQCAGGVEDLNHDGRAELVVEATLSGFATREPPHVRLALWPREHRFALDADPDARQAYYAKERVPRELELVEARRVLDVNWALRLALELAALSYAEGAAATEQIRVFDAALAGLVLEASQAAALVLARARIHDVWNAKAVSPELP